MLLPVDAVRFCRDSDPSVALGKLICWVSRKIESERMCLLQRMGIRGLLLLTPTRTMASGGKRMIPLALADLDPTLRQASKDSMHVLQRVAMPFQLRVQVFTPSPNTRSPSPEPKDRGHQPRRIQ